jgi:hypothetical protein
VRLGNYLFLWKRKYQHLMYLCPWILQFTWVTVFSSYLQNRDSSVIIVSTSYVKRSQFLSWRWWRWFPPHRAASRLPQCDVFTLSDCLESCMIYGELLMGVKFVFHFSLVCPKYSVSKKYVVSWKRASVLQNFRDITENVVCCVLNFKYSLSKNTTNDVEWRCCYNVC